VSLPAARSARYPRGMDRPIVKRGRPKGSGIYEVKIASMRITKKQMETLAALPGVSIPDKLRRHLDELCASKRKPS
jgi:hypothetical protein